MGDVATELKLIPPPLPFPPHVGAFAWDKFFFRRWNSNARSNAEFKAELALETKETSYRVI